MARRSCRAMSTSSSSSRPRRRERGPRIENSVGWAKSPAVSSPRGQRRCAILPTFNVTDRAFAHPTRLLAALSREMLLDLVHGELDEILVDFSLHGRPQIMGIGLAQ